jgi:3-hydroxyisobutyrate dehydrogenase-like beta-hydroxyacid dehydrogenase
MSKPQIGYLGMGILGSAMAGRLRDAGFPVMVWNRSKDKCAALAAKDAKVADTVKEVIESCDITFACTSDPASARSIVFGETGVLSGMAAGKKFVDMSTVDEQTSKDIATAINAKGGHFLEAPVSGSKGPALQGQLVILAAGDKALCELAQPCFDVFGKRTFFLGDVGAGARMKLVVNMIMGINIASLGEGLAVGTKAGLQGADILEVLKEGALACPMYGLKGPTMLEGKYDPAFPLKHQQKDVRLAIALADQFNQPLPLAAAANETFKAARAAGFSDDDMSKIYEVIKSE